MIGIALLAISAVALFAKQLSFFRVAHSEYMIPLNLILKYTAALGIVCISYTFRHFLRFLMPIGDTSYSLYLIHAYTITLVSNLVLGSWAMSAAVFFAVTFAISIVWYGMVKLIKTPLTKKLKL